MTGLGLIAAIGAQNVFVLTQAVGRRNLILVPLVCFLCDVVLMSAGIAGVGALLASDGRILTLAAAGGAVFLALYGLRSLRAAIGGGGLEAGEASDLDAKGAVLAALGVTLLNPHVYLDTLVLMGGIGSRYPLPDRWAFLGGVLAASFLWFFGLSLFGSLLAPLLRRRLTWTVIQTAVCALLWYQAAGLFRYAAERIFRTGV